MSDKNAQSSKPGKVSQPQTYHKFIDREHPDNYRQAEVQALVRAIRARENRLVLGLPGMGISNLLRFLVAKAGLVEPEVYFAYLNCDALDDCLDSETFFETIAGQLYEQGLVDKPERVEQGYRRLEQLAIRIGVDKLRRIVIVVDQADRMLETAGKSFYRQLKALTDFNKGVCYIFAASACLADVVDPGNLLFAGRRLPIGPLNERDCAGAIAEEARRLEANFDVVEQKQLTRLTGGHPGLLRAVSSAIVDEGLDLLATEAMLVKRLLSRGDIQYRCQKIWNELDLTKQAALYFLTHGQPASVTADTLTWLRDFRLVDKRGGLFSPIFESFVAAQEIKLEPVTIVEASQNEQGAIVAGKVFRGSQEVHVAPLELRLIACLKRKQKIYTKNEIIEYVYEDEVKDEGILDSRIENLVRQVRNRLGDQYIRAHWGQGYEFFG